MDMAIYGQYKGHANSEVLVLKNILQTVINVAIYINAQYSSTFK